VSALLAAGPGMRGPGVTDALTVYNSEIDCQAIRESDLDQSGLNYRMCRGMCGPGVTGALTLYHSEIDYGGAKWWRGVVVASLVSINEVNLR